MGDRRRGELRAVHPVLAARDVEESIAFFHRLGFVAIFRDSIAGPRYAAVARDGVELHLQWADPGQWIAGLDRPVYRFPVLDVDALFRAWSQAGCLPAKGSDGSPWAVPADTPWGTREFHLRDPAGNGLQFYQSRLGPGDLEGS